MSEQIVIDCKTSEIKQIVKDHVAKGYTLYCFFADPTDRAGFVVFNRVLLDEFKEEKNAKRSKYTK